MEDITCKPEAGQKMQVSPKGVGSKKSCSDGPGLCETLWFLSNGKGRGGESIAKLPAATLRALKL